MSAQHRFIDALLALSMKPGAMQAPDRRTMAAEHRNALLMTLVALHTTGLGVTGAPHPNPPDTCDLCGTRFADTRAFIDGMTGRDVMDTPFGVEGGAWANMCPACFTHEGRGIGWGIGQLYALVTARDGTTGWALIGGGDPALIMRAED